MDSARSLKFTTEANGGGQFNDGGFIFDCLGCFDSGFHGVSIVITVFDMLGVPSIISVADIICTRKLQNVSRHLR